MTRAAIYVRISDDREGRALGVDRQEADCRALAARLGYEIVEVYRDNDISASTRTRKLRPDYRRMLADAAARSFEVILAATQGRITRKPREHEDLIELAETAGTRFEYDKSPRFDLNTADGRMMARIVAAADAGEAERIAERVIRKKLETAAAGQWSGGRRPYGFEPDGVTIRSAEAKIVAELTDALLNGASLRGLCADLNSRKAPSPTGKPWDPSKLRAVLKRPRNAGLREHQGQIVGKAQWPAIVDETRWRAVCSILANPERRTSPGPAPRWLLSGIAVCGVCGATMRACSPGSRATHTAYGCERGKCVVRAATEVDAYVSAVAVERLKRPDAIDLLRPAAPEVDVVRLNAEASALRQQLDDLADDLGLDPRTLGRRTAKVNERLAEVEQALADAGRGSAFSGVVDTADPGAAWERLDLDRKRAIIDLLMTVVVNPARKGRRPGWRPGESYFDPASVSVLPPRGFL